MSEFSLQTLQSIIAERVTVEDGSSWTAKLVAGGIEKVSKKFGEEATEVIIASLVEDDRSLTAEAADLLYHLLVVLHMRNIDFGSVMTELETRTAQSGLQEKAARNNK